MKILAIDPSSTRTGYALVEVRSDDRITIIEAGAFTAHKGRLQAIDRIRSMLRQFVPFVIEIQSAGNFPDIVLIEVSTSSWGKGRKKGRGKGLTVYGMAAGAWLSRLDTSYPGIVHAIEANTWTRLYSGGRAIDKDSRIETLKREFPAYSRYAEKDKGGDVADAISLALTYIRHKEITRDDTHRTVTRGARRKGA